jgi:hypothetical protein
MIFTLSRSQLKEFNTTNVAQTRLCRKRKMRETLALMTQGSRWQWGSRSRGVWQASSSHLRDQRRSPMLRALRHHPSHHSTPTAGSRRCHRTPQSPLQAVTRAAAHHRACHGECRRVTSRPLGERRRASSRLSRGRRRPQGRRGTPQRCRGSHLRGSKGRRRSLRPPLAADHSIHRGKREMPWGRERKRRKETRGDLPPGSHRSPPPRAVVTVSPLSSFIGSETGTNRDRDEAAAHSSFRRHGEGDAPVRRIRHR